MFFQLPLSFASLSQESGQDASKLIILGDVSTIGEKALSLSTKSILAIHNSKLQDQTVSKEMDNYENTFLYFINEQRNRVELIALPKNTLLSRTASPTDAQTVGIFPLGLVSSRLP